MAPSTQTKKAKKGGENISAKLALTIKSGKYSLGYKSTLKQMRAGKGQCPIPSSPHRKGVKL
jgi:large subunit ribosomal protein L30e